MSINFNPTINVNELYKSKVDNAQKTYEVKTEYKKETKDSTYYVDQIKKNIPGTEVTVKSMTSSDVQKYYEEWKKTSIPATEQTHQITVSPKVLEKMKNDPKYAEEMMAKIKYAATPQGFEGAQLLEYKVIVKDDGEIEVLACADFMIGKKNKVSDDDDDEKKKKAKKRLEQLQFSRSSFDNKKLNAISEEKIDKNLISYDNYLYQNAIIAKIKNNIL
ncbi:hypothetical protein [Clostridium uliginosum]|uniref:Uncharacterized protein n=1 Tax=Clostridium uliginosum TaxID=119641 RepID=A0A1I1IRJ7_9CLOT|nr:hypothetical protein [Clostridium uliginosum]SFC38322.1 hypothetical protein SAMN05421842_10337 [Clostridium uliginosum]